MERRPFITRAVVIGALALAGAAVLPTAAPAASLSIRIGPPPPPRIERVPPPRAGQFWTAGHWERRADRYVWVGGGWVRDRPGYAYRAPQWRQVRGEWIYLHGGWDRVTVRRDRDRDGVPDRRDARPNDPRWR